MRKIKLFMAAFALTFGVRTASAQTDVTATYLTNADFSQGTPIDNNVCTYGKDMTTNNTTYYGAQPIDGWTNASVGETDSGYDNSKLAGALFAYGSTPWLAGSGTSAPATDPDGNAGNAAGLCAVWGGSVQYTQDVTLPAGSYTIRFKVYNATTNNGSGKFITTNLFGFVPNGGTAYFAPNKTFAIGQWSTVAVTFNLTAETAGKISMGFVGPSGNANMPHLFVDHVKILENKYYINETSKVGVEANTNWINASDGMQGNGVTTDDGRNTKMAARYGTSAEGEIIYQEVSGLDKGIYEVVLYAYSQNEWNNYGASLNNDAGDVGFVAADGAYTIKEWINARRGPGYPADGPGIYTLSNVTVNDGTLRLSYNIAKANQTEWHAIQIKSLIRTNDLDLTEFINAYETALGNAKAIDQTSKMASYVKNGLQSAIDTYDEGKVDKTNQTALEDATDALKNATELANKSITSYAVIAAGSIPDNSLEGWTCETQVPGQDIRFQVNTWSSEGNSDGSNMKTPFIENWTNKGNYLGVGRVYYKLEGLEPGEVYYAQALVRSYNEANSDAPNGPDFFINDVTTKLSQEGTTFTYNKMSGIYATLGGAATIGTDGTLTLGIEVASDRNYNWVAFKNVSIQSMDDAFNAAVAKVTALNSHIPTAAYNEANDVVTSYQGSNYPTTAAEFETAIAAIEAAATKGQSFVLPYEKWIAMKSAANELKDVANDNTEANGVFASSINTQNNAAEASTTVEALNTATSGLKDAMVTYVGVANPVGDGVKFDLTFMLTNPDLSGFAAWQKNIDGWFTDQTFSSQNFQTMNEGTKMFMEYWSDGNNATSGYVLYQKLTLAPGTYNMAAECKAGWGSGASTPNGTQAITFSAGDTDGTSITSANLAPASIEFVQMSSGEVKIGLKAHDGNTCNWMGIGYVKLYKVQPKTFAVNENENYDTNQEGAGKVNLTRTIKTGVWNTIWLPFSMTADELKATFGNDVAIAQFSETVNENATNQSTINFNTMSAPAISPNVPVLLKTSTAGTSYTIEGRTVVAGTPQVAGTNFNFVGTTAASTDVASGDYFISSNQLFTSKGATTLKGTRAYLKTTATGARIVSLVIDGEDTTTAIENVENGTITTGKVYNLQGQEVKSAQKGIFIQNGKKVVLK